MLGSRANARMVPCMCDGVHVCICILDDSVTVDDRKSWVG